MTVTEPAAAHAEVAGGLAMMTAVRSVGVDDPAAVVEAAWRHLAAMRSAGVLSTAEDVRVARAVILGRVWQGFGVEGMGPDRYRQRAWWLGRFRELGWVHTWVRADRPSSAFGGVRLFRGAPLGHRDGIAWTSSLETAAWFARRCGSSGVVWRADVPPGRLLAAFPLSVPGSGLEPSTEYIVDTEGLPVVDRVAPGEVAS